MTEGSLGVGWYEVDLFLFCFLRQCHSIAQAVFWSPHALTGARPGKHHTYKHVNTKITAPKKLRYPHSALPSPAVVDFLHRVYCLWDVLSLYEDWVTLWQVGSPAVGLWDKQMGQRSVVFSAAEIVLFYTPINSTSPAHSRINSSISPENRSEQGMHLSW